MKRIFYTLMDLIESTNDSQLKFLVRMADIYIKNHQDIRNFNININEIYFRTSNPTIETYALMIIDVLTSKFIGKQEKITIIMGHIY